MSALTTTNRHKSFLFMIVLKGLRNEEKIMWISLKEENDLQILIDSRLSNIVCSKDEEKRKKVKKKEKKEKRLNLLL